MELDELVLGLVDAVDEFVAGLAVLGDVSDDVVVAAVGDLPGVL